MQAMDPFEHVRNIARTQQISDELNEVMDDSERQLAQQEEDLKRSLDLFDRMVGLSDSEFSHEEQRTFTPANIEFFRRAMLRTMFLRGKMPCVDNNDRIAMAFRAGNLEVYEILFNIATARQTEKEAENRTAN